MQSGHLSLIQIIRMRVCLLLHGMIGQGSTDVSGAWNPCSVFQNPVWPWMCCSGCQWWPSEVVKMVLQRGSHEVPSAICSLLCVACVYVHEYIVKKNFKLTYKTSQKQFFSKSLINIWSEFQVEILFGCLHLSHHPVPGKGEQWKKRLQKRRENITNQIECKFI